MVENEPRAGHFVVGLDVQACTATQLIKSVARNIIESISSGFQLWCMQTKGDRSRARARGHFRPDLLPHPRLLNPSLCCDARGGGLVENCHRYQIGNLERKLHV